MLIQKVTIILAQDHKEGHCFSGRIFQNSGTVPFLSFCWNIRCRCVYSWRLISLSFKHLKTKNSLFWNIFSWYHSWIFSEVKEKKTSKSLEIHKPRIHLFLSPVSKFVKHFRSFLLLCFDKKHLQSWNWKCLIPQWEQDFT